MHIKLNAGQNKRNKKSLGYLQHMENQFGSSATKLGKSNIEIMTLRGKQCNKHEFFHMIPELQNHSNFYTKWHWIAFKKKQIWVIWETWYPSKMDLIPNVIFNSDLPSRVKLSNRMCSWKHYKQRKRGRKTRNRNLKNPCNWELWWMVESWWLGVWIWRSQKTHTFMW